MDGKYGLSSEGVTLAPARKVFTLAHANKTLPLVERIVKDIVTVYQRMAITHQRLSQLSVQTNEWNQLERLVVDQERLYDGYLQELTEIGCELKDPGAGLVDFIGRHDGRQICLCWRLGEKRIDFWHEMQGGFRSRRSVAMLREG